MPVPAQVRVHKTISSCHSLSTLVLIRTSEHNAIVKLFVSKEIELEYKIRSLSCLNRSLSIISDHPPSSNNQTNKNNIIQSPRNFPGKSSFRKHQPIDPSIFQPQNQQRNQQKCPQPSTPSPQPPPSSTPRTSTPPPASQSTTLSSLCPPTPSPPSPPPSSAPTPPAP